MEQLDLYRAETTWFHVFKAMIDSGDVALLGPHAVTVYLVVKAYTNFSTGRAFPAVDTLVEKSGVSKSQVLRSLGLLEEHGYVTKQREGRKNVYTLREKVAFTDKDGRPAAVATWDYLPSTVEAARAELKRFRMDGANETSIINIERLTLNVQINQGGVNFQNSVVDLSQITDPEVRKAVASFMRRQGKVVDVPVDNRE